MKALKYTILGAGVILIAFFVWKVIHREDRQAAERPKQEVDGHFQSTISNTGEAGAEKAEQPVAEKFDIYQLTNSTYRIKAERHREIKRLLASPARHTPEMREVILLCQQWNLPPFVVAPAYNLAYERFVFFSDEPFGRLQLERNAADKARRLGITWPENFLENLYLKVQPTQFIGQMLSVAQDGEALSGEISYEQLDEHIR